MDSENSHDGSSGNESNDEGGQSPVSIKSQEQFSTKSNGSRSRSSSPESRVQSALSQNSQDLTHSQDGPCSPEEEHNSAEESHHSEDSHQSLNDSQHSLDDGCRSQGDRVNSSIDEERSPDGTHSPIYSGHSPSTKKMSSSEEPVSNLGIHMPSEGNNQQSTLDKKSHFSSTNRDSSPDSHHSDHSLDSNKSEEANNFSETSVFKRISRSQSKSPIKSRSNSRSTSSSSVENETSVNDKNTDKSFGNQPKSPEYSQRSNSEGKVKRAKEHSDDDNGSVKSDSSSSLRSVSSRSSHKSASSGDSRSVHSQRSIRSTRSRRKSDSSVSSDSSRDSNHKKGGLKSSDTHAEDVSDGDMISDHENDVRRFKEESRRPEINISHEDLSDVSDLEGSLEVNLDNDDGSNEASSKHNEALSDGKSLSPDAKQIAVKNKGTEEGEEQLDFEAEDGECAEIEQTKDKDDNEEKSGVIDDEVEKSEEKKENKELEEGEVTDEDDMRPEETEPRPVCRFFSRGQCTWGASCRFLHPGVTDKGNYTMFELIRPVVPGEFGRDERMYSKPEPPLIESAWERGLRTAKEMLRKSVKRKEQDIDFEEKKMNLSLAQEEFDKENGYYGRVPSPEPRYVRHIPAEYPMARPPPEEYYGRRQIMYEPEYAPLPPSRERVRPYRELPTHRMPDYYNNKYEEEPISSSKRPKPKREVIVQRVEERQGRGDEWSDPWMRSKSPAGRRKDRKRSYSSGSSYSSSSSSRSSSDSSRSTYRSRSRSSHRRRSSRSRRQVSPSVIVSERKAANERAALMNPPAPKRRAPSPGMMRVTGAANPPAPSRDDLRRSRSKLAAALARVKGRRSSRSSSGSSASSSSDSDSSDSSSSTSRDESSPRRPAGVEMTIAKAMDALKSGGLEKNKIKLNLKNPVGMKKNDISESRKPEQSQGKKRTASSPPAGDPKSKKATSRREELLKQLKAVEDAIAKKRSKVM